MSDDEATALLHAAMPLCVTLGMRGERSVRAEDMLITKTTQNQIVLRG